MQQDDPVAQPNLSVRWAVSPKYTQEDLWRRDFHTDVAILQDQFKGWFFDQARFLRSATNPEREHCALAILTLTSAYFEAIAEFLTGGDSGASSPAFFEHGLRSVFPGLIDDIKAKARSANAVDVVADALYDEVRCGLFHSAITRARVQLQWNVSRALSFQVSARPTVASHDADSGELDHSVDVILVDPEAFLMGVESHFALYLDRLRNADPASAMRKSFALAFDRRTGRAPRDRKTWKRVAPGRS